MNVCSYHLQEAGATPVQEIAYSLATAIGVLDAVRDSGQVEPEQFGQVFGSISFFVNAGIRFVEEICKLRAFTELWDRIGLERYGVTDAKARRFRYGVQVNSLGLTEAQPENNVQRIVLEMLAVTLSKGARARSVQLPAWNEALGLPRPWDQQWSLRMQQVLAFESDLLEYDDIFDGSTVIEAAHRRAARRGVDRAGGGARPRRRVRGGRRAEGPAGALDGGAHAADRDRRADGGRRQPRSPRPPTRRSTRRATSSPSTPPWRPRSSPTCRPGARRATTTPWPRRSFALRQAAEDGSNIMRAVDRAGPRRRHHRRVGRPSCASVFGEFRGPDRRRRRGRPALGRAVRGGRAT